MDHFLNPLAEYKDLPIEMLIGKGAQTKRVLFIPVLFAIIVDTKEANDIIGIRGAPLNKRKCRMCTSMHLNTKTCTNTLLRRNDVDVEGQQRRGQQAWIDKLLGRPLIAAHVASLE